MGKASGNYYTLRKQYNNAMQKISELEDQVSELKRKLHLEKERDYNRVITKLTKKVQNLQREREKNERCVDTLQKKCEKIVQSGFLHYDLYKLLFDKEIETSDLSKMLIFGDDTPDKRLKNYKYE